MIIFYYTCLIKRDTKKRIKEMFNQCLTKMIKKKRKWKEVGLQKLSYD